MRNRAFSEAYKSIALLIGRIFKADKNSSNCSIRCFRPYAIKSACRYRSGLGFLPCFFYQFLAQPPLIACTF